MGNVEESGSLSGDDWLTVGQMAELCSVSRKALRLYHERGILSPAMLDRDTGYRYYVLDQVPIVDQMCIRDREIIRSLKNLAKKADSIVIATDFDREGELIGADALSCVRDVNATAPVSRARYSAFTKEEITHAFSNLVEMDDCLASAGASRQDIDLIWGAALTRYLTLVKMCIRDRACT